MLQKLQDRVRENIRFIRLGSLIFAGGFVASVLVPEALNVRGREDRMHDGVPYVVTYDTRAEGVVVRKGFTGTDLHMVDTNYDGIADYVLSRQNDEREVSLQEQSIFSDVTAHFYKIHTNRAELFK